ncbi:MAG: hypothetical protein WCJ56_08635 [bacterium]
MAITQRDYPADLVEAARRVLLELTRLLAEYRDDVVVIGGWVPELLLANHIGSIDVDLALNHIHLKEIGYKSIERLLLDNGYFKDQRQPFIFHKIISVNGLEIDVEVDFLAGEYPAERPKSRTQKVQDVNTRKARGCDLAFDMYDEVKIAGILPGGEKATATIRVASIVSFLIMKGMALGRGKEKDSYDIYFCLTRYHGGLDKLIADFRPYICLVLVREGLEKIADEFASVDHIGPNHVANFNEIYDEPERAALKRDVYERVDYLLKQLGVI